MIPEILLASAGFASLIKYKLPKDNRLRSVPILQDGLDCSLCLGFWFGIIMISVHYYCGQPTTVLLPLMTSAFCWLFDSTIDLIQTIAVYFDKDVDNET